MRFFSVATFGLLAAVTAAEPLSYGYGHGYKSHWPAPAHHNDRRSGGCIRKKDAKEMAGLYSKLVGAFKGNEGLIDYLADDFIDVSQSISTFFGVTDQAEPVTFDKTSFAAAAENGKERPTPITIISEPVLDCDTFAIKWTSTFGAGNTVRGISILEVEKGGKKGKNKKGLLFKRWDVEFNSLLWLANMGGGYCLSFPDGNKLTNGNLQCAA